MEVLLRDAVIAPQMALGLVPEVLDAVDVVAVLGEQLGVIDADVMKVRHVEHVIGPEAVRVTMLSGRILLSMMGKSVAERAFGMVTA